MSDSRKEAEEKMEKAIFISADCWLCVFDLLTPSQLGLGIAMISHRFDFYVDEHFKTRKWKLGEIRIRSKIGENGTKQMEIVNSNWKAFPIPQNALLNKIIGFRGITIIYIDQKVITFFHRFRRVFAICAIDLYIMAENVRILEYILHNIWPMLRNVIDIVYLDSITFRRVRQLAPSLFIDSPSLRYVYCEDASLPAFPPDDSAAASDGQVVAKWLFTPHPDGMPKWYNCSVNSSDQWSSTIKQLKTVWIIPSPPPPFSFLKFVLNFNVTKTSFLGFRGHSDHESGIHFGQFEIPDPKLCGPKMREDLATCNRNWKCRSQKAYNSGANARELLKYKFKPRSLFGLRFDEAEAGKKTCPGAIIRQKLLEKH